MELGAAGIPYKKHCIQSIIFTNINSNVLLFVYLTLQATQGLGALSMSLKACCLQCPAFLIVRHGNQYISPFRSYTQILISLCKVWTRTLSWKSEVVTAVRHAWFLAPEVIQILFKSVFRQIIYIKKRLVAFDIPTPGIPIPFEKRYQVLLASYNPQHTIVVSSPHNSRHLMKWLYSYTSLKVVVRIQQASRPCFGSCDQAWRGGHYYAPAKVSVYQWSFPVSLEVEGKSFILLAYWYVF